MACLIDQRVVIVGEAPGRRDAGTTPLFGTRGSHAGWRLREIVGFSRTEWVHVRRVNLFATLPEHWDAGTARTTALAWMHALLRDHRVVCCGRRVSMAFMCADLEPFAWRHVPRHAMLGPVDLASIPHPSGRSLAYNDPAVRARARAFLRAALVLQPGGDGHGRYHGHALHLGTGHGRTERRGHRTAPGVRRDAPPSSPA